MVLRLIQIVLRQHEASQTPSYLQVLFVVVEDDGQEGRHEDVGVDEDVQDEEEGEEDVGVVRRHPDNEKQKIKFAGLRY